MMINFPSNPYIAGDPVRGSDHFIGRTDVLRDVLRVLRNPNANAIVLYGQRRIGKTSILLQLQQQLTETQIYTPVYLDLHDKASLPLAELLYQLAQRIATTVGLEAEPRSQFDSAGDFFSTSFLPQVVKQAGQQSLILLFDEFDVLDSPRKDQAGESFFPYLRGWMSGVTGVKFVFVLGRRPEELSTDTLAALKQVGRRQVSLMNREDSLVIIHQSEENESLYWSDSGADRVWYWTQGHPYLTQLLCSEVWESAYDEEPETPPMVDAIAVDTALPKALESGEHAFSWIWGGLPPAERIVMAAMAEMDKTVINQDELADILTRSGVRLILRELELAPETLMKWDLLRPTDGGYRFAVPLLKQWVAVNNPLPRVKRDLDSLDPLAKTLYQSAEGLYERGNLNETELLLRRTLDINPNHMQARLLLGRVLLGQGEPVAAITELKPVYEFDARLGKQALIGALLALAESQNNEDEQLETYNRVLDIEAGQPVALEKKRTVWRQRAEIALQQKEFDISRQAYEQIGDLTGITRVNETQRKLELERRVREAEQYEGKEDWVTAVNIYEELLAEFPDELKWQQRLEETRKQAMLAETYSHALYALENKNME